MPRVVVDTAAASEELVAAPGDGRFIRIIGAILTADGPTDLSLDGGDTVILPLTIGATGGGGAVVPPSDQWGFDLPVNTALNLTNSASAGVQGSVTYSVLGKPVLSPPRS